MGGGDQWPAIHEKILAADILILSTPSWMGHPCSVAQQVMERLDAAWPKLMTKAGPLRTVRSLLSPLSAMKTGHTRRSLT